MIEALRWLITIEIVGVAALPLSVWLLRSLPDFGYGVSKIAGLVFVTYLTWIVGSFIPVAGTPVLPLVAVLLIGVLGWWLLLDETVTALASIRKLLIAEEALFLAGFVVWSLMRAFLFHPAIAHTEQLMDMALLNASLRSPSYPAFDPWMSGHTINYYYLGYLMCAMPIKLSGVPAAIGYNLALSTLFALTLTGTFSIGYALTRRLSWAFISPLFVALVGNWHAALVQIPHGQLPGNSTWWFFDSTRVVDGQNTINEFPFFSYLLGDLHPHVMALPVTLLVIAIGCAIAMGPRPFLSDLTAASVLRLALIAVPTGLLFAMNSWDFPTYLLVVAGCIVVAAYVDDTSTGWWKSPARSIPALAAVSIVLFLPFYLHFHSLAHGIGLVSQRTDTTEFLQVFGVFLVGAALLVATLAFLLQPAHVDADVEQEVPFATRGQEAGRLSAGSFLSSPWLLITVLILVSVTVGNASRVGTLAICLALGASAAVVLVRVVNTASPNRSDAVALGLAIVAYLVLAMTEVIYLRDSFDGSTMYRMNTVFKFYYQGWTLLGLAAAYGAFRVWHTLRMLSKPSYAWLAIILIAAGTALGLVYTVLAPTSSIQNYGDRSLDGMAWIQSEYPSDYAAIRWLVSNAPEGSVVLEAVGGDYGYSPPYARVSAFAGLPTVMGWIGHEDQWRPGDPEVGTRSSDVNTIYTTQSVATASTLLRKYAVHYVFLGASERTAYAKDAPALDKFARFMRVAFRAGTGPSATTVYAW